MLIRIEARYLLLLLLPLVAAVTKEDVEKVRLDSKGYQNAHNIHANWYLHSIKALLGQLGKDLLQELPLDLRRSMLDCLNVITDKRDIVSAAHCISHARDSLQRLDKEAKERAARGEESFVVDATSTTTRTPTPATTQSAFVVETAASAAPPTQTPPTPKKVKKIRKKSSKKGKVKKTSIESQAKPKSKKVDVKSRLEKKYMEVMLAQGKRRRAKRSPHRLIASQVARSDTHVYTVRSMSSAPALLSPKQATPVKRITRLMKTIMKPEEAEQMYDKNGKEMKKWTNTYKDLIQLKKAMDNKSKEPGAKVYEMRMFDLVIGNDEPTKAMGEKEYVPDLLQKAYDLIDAIEKKPKGEMTKNIKFLSPRFAPIMPDRMEERGHLSPSILAFYNDDTEQQIAPLPKLLEATGMSESDREDVLEMTMELSGARETIDDAIKILRDSSIFGMDQEVSEVTGRLADVFKDLERSFLGPQKADIDKRGYTFMETNQIEELLEKHGVHDNEEINAFIPSYSNLTRSEREEALWDRVRMIARNETNPRSRRSLTVPSVLEPTVLSPYMFSPVYGLVVLGPVVLSPSLFSPLLLNPAVLSPYVMSPAVAMPFILSPYLLSPYVISPLIMAPFILNPYVISPNVINPYVLSPLILSPVVLGPDVISPMVLGGNILSPTVLSPSVLSPSVLMASVLSPSFLS